MRTVDLIDVAAPIEPVWQAASDVERWPAILPHYRFVTIEDRRPDGTIIVAMSANRPFGPLNWPTWWTSEMWIDAARHQVRYRHIRGITTGMDVVWRLTSRNGGTHIELIHEWTGPAWPLIRYPAAEWVIGPVFVHGIASRTLAGVKRAAEAAARAGGPGHPTQARTTSDPGRAGPEAGR
ncbi:MAG: SRPBCC family protein [Gemmatimonadales bacterium]|nr:SRPBCC family protein [Gemmatimonadales bacterium]